MAKPGNAGTDPYNMIFNGTLNVVTSFMFGDYQDLKSEHQKKVIKWTQEKFMMTS